MNFEYKFPPEVIHNRNFPLKILQIKILLEIMLVSPERIPNLNFQLKNFNHNFHLKIFQILIFN